MPTDMGKFTLVQTAKFSVLHPKAAKPMKTIAAKKPAKAAAAPAPKNAALAPKKVEEDDDDDDDLFGDDDEEDDEAAKALAAKRAEAAKAAKKEKKKPVERSQVVLEVKPWEAETDLEELAAKIKALPVEGLTWGEGHKLVPVAFGIKKLLVQCVIIDDLVLLDDITESIEQFEDYVHRQNFSIGINRRFLRISTSFTMLECTNCGAVGDSFFSINFFGEMVCELCGTQSFQQARNETQDVEDMGIDVMRVTQTLKRQKPRKKRKDETRLKPTEKKQKPEKQKPGDVELSDCLIATQMILDFQARALVERVGVETFPPEYVRVVKELWFKFLETWGTKGDIPILRCFTEFFLPNRSGDGSLNATITRDLLEQWDADREREREAQDQQEREREEQSRVEETKEDDNEAVKKDEQDSLKSTGGKRARKRRNPSGWKPPAHSQRLNKFTILDLLGLLMLASRVLNLGLLPSDFANWVASGVLPFHNLLATCCADTPAHVENLRSQEAKGEWRDEESDPTYFYPKYTFSKLRRGAMHSAFENLLELLCQQIGAPIATEAKNSASAEESAVIKLYCQMPPIAKLDNSLNTLKNCEQLSLSTNGIDRLIPLSGMKKLRILSLGRNQIKKIEKLDDVSDTLEELWLSYNVIATLDGLSGLTNLTTLYVSNNLIKSWDELDKLASLPKLRDVLFTGNPIYENLSKEEARLNVLKRIPKVAKIDGDMVKQTERDAALGQ
ncbi:hypothetical protein BBP00_00002961 [Phytophthora kernoviae]|uniref:Dynein axonemal light chain 1 n=2 Tax=Phytophthora kernoviae TaxID=325452 RepID=A0A3F2RVW3_9STRA|nr:hypothetical protein BBP00_00002961 [Phytophthora kernoviae]